MATFSKDKQELVSAEELRKHLNYDPITGRFTWATRRSMAVKIGQEAGYVMNKGYRMILFGARGYMAHRLAWLYHYGAWPTDQLDHINGDKDDNRIENLRVANDSQNQANVGLSRRNKSGVKGVSWNARRKKWTAEIRVNTKGKHLGYFDRIEDAACAYAAAAERFRGEFARTR